MLGCPVKSDRRLPGNVMDMENTSDRYLSSSSESTAHSDSEREMRMAACYAFLHRVAKRFSEQIGGKESMLDQGKFSDVQKKPSTQGSQMGPEQ